MVLVFKVQCRNFGIALLT
ncbi:TPA: DUF3265 domain-containing protein, partial [Vibrio parahaemolyticus]|nr:DUF3265 domain-containing protein [Vibrio parahaemolyticus]HCE3304395.1 DUF3265 domain-containing protein [Vibrio parahaemolyticus]HCH6003576.1 DUF3265 domain-containing protein [Vibrio parahaemolyticus]